MNEFYLQRYYDVRETHDEPDNTCRISLFEKGTENRVLQISGDLARRTCKLLHECPNYAALSKFNCYSAIRLLLGQSDIPDYETMMPIQGEKMYVREGLRRFGSPTIFQVTGQLLRNDSWKEIVAHTGLILGEALGDCVTLDKNHKDELSFRPWQVIEQHYFQPYKDWQPGYVTCFPPADLLPRLAS